MKYLIALSLPLVLSGCAFAPSGGIPLTSGAENIEIGSEKPASYYFSKGVVVGQDGGGCGYYGYFGTRQNALADLRNNAAQMGADYVQITSEQDSYKSMSCETNLYKIGAIAYRADAIRKEQMEAQKARERELMLDGEARESKRLMAEFIDTCKTMGFKPETDGMGMCLLTQQSRHDAALDRQQRHQVAGESLEAQRKAEYRRQIAAQEAAQAERAAQESAAMQGAIQSIQKGFAPPKPMRSTTCNKLGNTIHCTEY